jgi:TRAP-type C4-dicarboxylate transport system substrate-binding protein
MRFLKICTVGALAAVVLAFQPVAPASAATKYCDGPKVNWRYSLWGKRRAVTEGSEFISKAVKDLTCGKFSIKLYYGEQLSKSKENLDGLKVGAFEAAFVCSAYHPGKVRAMGVLDLPFLPISGFKSMRKVYDKVWEQDALKKSLGKWNSQRYLQNLLPMYEYMGRGKPPKNLADFKGKRLRALGGMGKAAKAIGAVPTTMPASETYTALQRGTVDAIGFPFTYTFAAYKLDEISKWYTTNLSAGNVNCIMALNNDAYKKLPKQYKKIMEDIKDDAYAAMIAAYSAKDKVNIPKWKKMGLTPVTFSQKDLAEFAKIGGKPVWDAWVAEAKGEVPNAQQLLDLVLKTAKGG